MTRWGVNSNSYLILFITESSISLIESNVWVILISSIGFVRKSSLKVKYVFSAAVFMPRHCGLDPQILQCFAGLWFGDHNDSRRLNKCKVKNEGAVNKKIIAIVIAFVLVAATLGLCLNMCNKPTPEDADDVDGEISVAQKTGRIGISIPVAVPPRIGKDLEVIQKKLVSEGYNADVRLADNFDAQIDNISDLVTSGCDILIVLPVNEFVLGNALESAKEKNIPVIAWERMIPFTDAVKYFLAYDNAGALHGKYLIEQLNLENSKKTVTIEIFPGDLTVGDASYYNALISSLDKHISDERVSILSHNTSPELFSPDEMSTSETDLTEAKARMEKLLLSSGCKPGGTALDAVLCKNDVIAAGVIEALKTAGFTAQDFPLVAGLGCDPIGVRNMLEGFQSMSLFLNPEDLGSKTLALANAILDDLSISSDTVVETDSRSLPAFLSKPIICTKQNYIKLLLDSGYYNSQDFQQ